MEEKPPGMPTSTIGGYCLSLRKIMLGRRAERWDNGRMTKRPRDPNQLGKLLVDIMSGEVQDTVSPAKRNPSAIKGRSGGVKGGAARAATLTPEQRTAIAKRAARSRWGNP
jgi:hypothetical protein